MQIQFNVPFSDGTTKEITGNKHKIKLDNGETVIVASHKKDSVYGKYWCVSDIESGMQISGGFEYSCMFYPNYKNTEKQLLYIAKTKLDFVLKEENLSINEFRKKSIALINKGE